MFARHGARLARAGVLFLALSPRPLLAQARDDPWPTWWETVLDEAGVFSSNPSDSDVVQGVSAVAEANAAEPPASEEVPAGPTEDHDWLEDVSWNLGVDGFYLLDWNRPADPGAAARVPHRAFDFTNGFALAFAIADVSYRDETFGATLQLRFGEGAARLIGNESPVFAPLKQAFVTWMPTDELTLDVGQFDTIYGAEVADSWRNLNYTRGALYFLMQPFFHQGLRVGVDAAEDLALTFLLVNGTNNPVDTNQSPHLGAQLTYRAAPALSLAAGYYTGAGSSGFGRGDPQSDDGWEHFVDLVFQGQWGMLSAIGNVDFYFSGPDAPEGSVFFWGLSLAVGVQFDTALAAAIRQEFLHDPDAFLSESYRWLSTTTLTFDVRPVEHLIFRLDTRFEVAGSAVFAYRGGSSRDTWLASTLGVVATVDP